MPLDDYVSTTAPASQSATTANPQKGKVGVGKNNKTKDIILVNPEMKDVSERVVDMQQRRKLSVQMKRLSSRLERARKIARMRPASSKQLERRAYKAAKQGIRKRFAGERGSEYQDLSASGKYAVDTLVDPKVKNIRTLVQRIMPRVRQSDSKRLHAARTHQQYKAFVMPQFNSVELDVNDFNKLWEQFVEEKKTLKNTNPCWTGYKPVGTKQKAGKTVPNCVPEEKNNINESFSAFYTAKDLGITAEGGFSMHPSVRVKLDEDAAGHMRQAVAAERSGDHLKAEMHRRIAAALKRGDMTSVNAMTTQLSKK